MVHRYPVQPREKVTREKVKKRLRGAAVAGRLILGDRILGALALVTGLAASSPPARGDDAASNPASATTAPETPRLSATRTTSPPRIDGKLDDPAWASAKAEGRFTQQEPYGGDPPSEPTQVRVLYDNQSIYVGIDCEQTHTPIVGRLTRRDEDSESDWVQVFIDSRRDGRFANVFAVNVAGVQVDGTLHDGAIFSSEWDENWEGRVASTAKGWSAELRIPLRSLRYAVGLPVQDWGIWVSRFIAARQERTDWPYIPRDVAAPIPAFARLDDLRDLPRPSRFEVRPFAVARLRRIDSNPDVVVRGWDSGLSGLAAGLDLKLHLSQSVTVDAAITPDFAQVEADQLVFNVTNYETQFPEKRALFLEGADQYRTPLSLFYSRRIGISPLTPTLKSGASATQPTEGTLVDFPQGATIYAAAKIGGRVSEAWSFEVLSAFASRNQYAVQLSPTAALPMGRVESRTIEPATAFNVFRLRRDLGANAQLGFLGTGTSRFEDTKGARTCPTGQSVLEGEHCFHDAYVGGIDGLVRFANLRYVLSGQLMGSVIDKGQTQTQLDGTAIEAGSKGTSAWVRLAKDGGRHVLAEVQYTGASRKLNYNDLGFMLRQNLHEVRVGLELRSLDPGVLTLERHLRLDLVDSRNLDGLDLGSAAELSVNARSKGFWYARVAMFLGRWRFDDREIGNGSSLERAGYWGAKTEISSDPRRMFSADLKVDTRFFASGSAISTQLTVSFRPLPNMQVELGPQLAYERGEQRLAWHASVPAGQHIFGALLAENAGATLRATYTFTPQISLQTFAQLFVATGHYSDFTSASEQPGARIRLSSLTRPAAGGDPADADFEQAALNANVLLRWDYRLGSAVFLVYGRSQIPNVRLTSGEAAELRLSAINRVPAIDVIMLKLSLWWAS